MPASTIPPRIKWAVDLMDVQPADQVLEIGCGPGAGAEAICAKLETGKLFAIDRSESGVDRTKRRNQKYVDAGRLVVRQIDLATLRVPVKRLNKVFAFNVNLFWVRPCDDEVALLHERVVPGGRGLPLLRGRPPRAGAQHREEGLREPPPRRLPGQRRGAEGSPGHRDHRQALSRSVRTRGPDDRQELGLGEELPGERARRPRAVTASIRATTSSIVSSSS